MVSWWTLKMIFWKFFAAILFQERCKWRFSRNPINFYLIKKFQKTGAWEERKFLDILRRLNYTYTWVKFNLRFRVFMKEKGWEGGELILSFSSITEQFLLWEYCHNFSGFSKTAKLHCCICCQLCLSSLDELVQLTIIKSGKAQNSLRAAVPSPPLHRGGGRVRLHVRFFLFLLLFSFPPKS